MAITKPGNSEECGPQRGRGRPQVRCDEETRVVIVDAARQAFAANGFAGTSTEALARSAGVSTKTLYRLFPTKAGLFEAMVVDRTDALVSTVKLRACDGGDVEAALAEALLMCGELMLDGEVIALQRVIAGESDKFPEIAETFFNKAIMRTPREESPYRSRGAIPPAPAKERTRGPPSNAARVISPSCASPLVHRKCRMHSQLVVDLDLAVLLHVDHVADQHVVSRCEIDIEVAALAGRNELDFVEQIGTGSILEVAAIGFGRQHVGSEVGLDHQELVHVLADVRHVEPDVSGWDG